ncbi:MAG: hypothetical protein FWH11_11460 [Micrococcales bacterium]|nr:hypothetical protein [Micrococcales bacterium]
MHYLAAKASVTRFAVRDRLRTRLTRREEGMETIEVAIIVAVVVVLAIGVAAVIRNFVDAKVGQIENCQNATDGC